ncbi:TPA: hypothetical protein DCG61_00240 [Patescibacteria group bacterium]|jgi:UDP-N-acetylmuramoyl-tripeptide--D-alanyl-D-alanine ligase|nr:hypothetical protein [Patescibacteria group bacterium]
MKQFVAKRLAILARQLIAKHKPKIIGITGSVGKTSARDAIYAVVSTAFWARKGHENYNNELGLPLAILGQKSPGRSAFGWGMILVKGYFSLWFGSFPKVLVLEMGVDKPGDMDYLLSIAKPDIAVITNIGISHYEFFGSTEAVAHEKGKLVTAVSSSGAVILNADNETAYAQRTKTSAKVIGYGFGDQSDVRMQIETEKFVVPAETKLIVHTPTQNFGVTVPAIGLPHISSCGSAVAVGLYLGLSIENIQKGLRSYKPVPGRLNLISGIRKTLIIDDSYNASPDSVNEALQIVNRLPHQHKVVILGDMLELGDLSESAHKKIGTQVGEMKIDKLITVGSLGKIIAEAAKLAGMDSEKIVSFNDSKEASDHIRTGLVPESAILIKGSQGVRMERISKELLADPMSATNLLPRQYGSWLEK